MRKVTVSRMREGYAEAVLTFRITYVTCMIRSCFVLDIFNNMTISISLRFLQPNLDPWNVKIKKTNYAAPDVICSIVQSPK